MGKRETLGDFEQLVLFAVLRLGDRAYGTPIKQEIENRTGRGCSLGALYTTLDRLESKGLLSSHLGERTPERGGRAKKYFKLEAAGSIALKQAYASTMNMVQGFETVLGGAQ